MGITTNDRIEDFVISMATALRKAKKELRFAGSNPDDIEKAKAEVDEARKSLVKAIRMYKV